jgi:hypothetical protein
VLSAGMGRRVGTRRSFPRHFVGPFFPVLAILVRIRAWDMEALLRERRKGLHVLDLLKKSEEGHAEKTCSSICR